jgi:hypothetical protein
MKGSVLVPSFAVVGHPNEGKSSVVSTLAEDDHVRISPVPGETLVCAEYPVRLDGQEIIRFVDTPGFQHPQKTLRWMQARAEQGRGLPEAFVREHQDDPAMLQDVELMRPLAQGSGLIYVVDGSRPVRRHDLAEMEILRLTGNPRMAVINPKEEGGDFREDWKAACARYFNSTRVFNAHQATYAERIALLESLKSINQDWEPALARTIEAFQQDWARRNSQVAASMCDLLLDCLTHVETRNLFQTTEEEAAKAQLIQAYQRTIADRERRAHAAIRRLFKHNLFRLDIPAQSILQEDLFTERTWQMLGLNRQQIILAAALVGGGAGVKLDLVLPHLTFGVCTVSGAALAAAAAWWQGENMARLKIQKLKLGGVQIAVGPNRNPQFPFILLDRALLYYRHTINWAHARRDVPQGPAATVPESKLGYTSRWTRDRRNICAEFVKSLTRKNREKQETATHKMHTMLKDVLLEISTEKPVVG